MDVCSILVPDRYLGKSSLWSILRETSTVHTIRSYATIRLHTTYEPSIYCAFSTVESQTIVRFASDNHVVVICRRASRTSKFWFFTIIFLSFNRYPTLCFFVLYSLKTSQYIQKTKLRALLTFQQRDGPPDLVQPIRHDLQPRSQCSKEWRAADPQGTKQRVFQLFQPLNMFCPPGRLARGHVDCPAADHRE